MLIILATIALAQDNTPVRPIVDQRPTAVELATELNQLMDEFKSPASKNGVTAEQRTWEVSSSALCTQVNGQDQICTWREGEGVGFSADRLGPYRRWDTAVPEQIRRLKVLNGS